MPMQPMYSIELPSMLQCQISTAHAAQEYEALQPSAEGSLCLPADA